MLKNNIEIDVKVKCVEEQTTQAELAEKSCHQEAGWRCE